METFVLAQVLGAIGSLAFLVGVQLKNKQSILLFLIANTLIWSLAMFLVGAWSGLISNSITLLPALYAHHVNSQRGAKAKSSYVLAMWLVLFGCWLVAASQFVDIFPLIGSSIYMFSLFQKKPSTVRKMLVFNQLAWLVYDLTQMLYSGAFFAGCIIISTVIALYRYRRDKPSQHKRYYHWHHHPTHR
jgi:hypothetical protein